MLDSVSTNTHFALVQLVQYERVKQLNVLQDVAHASVCPLTFRPLNGGQMKS